MARATNYQDDEQDPYRTALRRQQVEQLAPQEPANPYVGGAPSGEELPYREFVPTEGRDYSNSRPPATDTGGTEQNPYQSWLDNESGMYDPVETAPPATTAPPADTTGWNTGGFSTPGYTAADAPQNAPIGWEQTNWADPTMQTPKYVVGRILAKYPSTPAGLAQAMAEIQQAYPGATFTGKDYLTIPGVGSFDVIQAAGDDAISKWQWGLMADAEGKPAGWALDAMNVPTSAPVLPELTATTAPTSTSQYPTADIDLGRTTTEEDPFYAAQRDKILALLSQDPTAVTGESPGVRGSVDAYRAEQERARRERLRAEMEQLGAVGLEDSGAAGQARAQGFEDMGTNVANYAATAVVNEMSARRAEVAQALSLATQMGMTQEAQDLQRQLANIDNAIRQQQFSDNLGWLMAQYQLNYPLIYAAILNGASPTL